MSSRLDAIRLPFILRSLLAAAAAFVCAAGVQAQGTMTGGAFGSATASCDFNGDGFADLALGAPWTALYSEGFEARGAVHVLYGCPETGLCREGRQLWHQDSDGVGGVAAEQEEFGSALAGGDFDGDDFCDLAIGVPGELHAGGRPGAVQVLFGSSRGLTASGSRLVTQTGPVIPGDPENGNRFGASLAAGDFDGDGFADLAIGVPGERINGKASAGAVDVAYGCERFLEPLLSCRVQGWSQDTNGVAENADTGDSFGSALAAGDFTGDGRDDLAIGVPGEDLGSFLRIRHDAGYVNVLHSCGPQGLCTANNQGWSQRTEGVLGTAAEGDRFGSALAAGDFDGDARDDLAIGVPFEKSAGPSGSRVNAGLVNVLYGCGAGGLCAAGNQRLQHGSAWLDSADDIRFGFSLAAGDVTGDGLADLAIGAPYRPFSLDPYPAPSIAGGSVSVIPGCRGEGLCSDGRQEWSRAAHASLDHGFFGWALAMGDFDRDGRLDLAVGAPTNPSVSAFTAGSVDVLYGCGPGGLCLEGLQKWYPIVRRRVSFRLGSGADDAEERPSGTVNLSSNDLELVFDGANQSVGIRFRSVYFPGDATILRSYVQFQTDEVSTGAASLRIEGEAADDARAFTATPRNVSSMPRTGARVNWAPAAWASVGAASGAQRTPDVTPILREIAGRPGWRNGNSLALIVSGSGKRVAESYECGCGGEARLVIEYLEGDR